MDFLADYKFSVPGEDDGRPWYGVRLFSRRLKEVWESLAGCGMDFFVPMHGVDTQDASGRIRHAVRPVVSNLLFLKKTLPGRGMDDFVNSSPYGMSIIRSVDPASGLYVNAEISAGQMRDFIIMCNPELAVRKFMGEREAALKPGTLVAVHHGPLRGVTGKLVRAGKKYYLLKDIPGIAVAIQVSRWCCEPLQPRG